MNLSPQQVEAYDKIMAWLKTPTKRFALAGYAGTGKTTLARYIAEQIGENGVIFCAFSGKAAHILRQKGIQNSGTIHENLYTLIGEDEDAKPRFGLAPRPQFLSARLIVVDEYSMLSDEIVRDLEMYAKKILYLGDPFQLPPISGKEIIKPDFFLTEVHRQALDSGIIRAATDIRQNGKIDFQETKDFLYKTEDKFHDSIWSSVEQIICGTNSTRNQINAFMRNGRGENPEAGDKIICRKNNRREGVFNGQIGTILDYIQNDNFSKVSFEADGKNYEYLKSIFETKCGSLNRSQIPAYLNYFQFAYAITCHLSQGSEFDSVAIYNEPIGKTHEEKCRWIYTAITRAKNKCYLIQGKN